MCRGSQKKETGRKCATKRLININKEKLSYCLPLRCLQNNTFENNIVLHLSLRKENTEPAIYLKHQFSLEDEILTMLLVAIKNTAPLIQCNLNENPPQ